MIYYISPRVFPGLITYLCGWTFLLLLCLPAEIYSQFQETNNGRSGAETVYTFPVSGQIYDAFSQKPVSGATARFIILPDSTNFQTDHLGHFNGKWKSMEEDIVQNFPNPFNPTTTIKYPEGYDILEIYTILGQLLIRTDIHSQNQIDIEMASGVYVYRVRDLQTGKVAQNKMIALDGGYFTIYLEEVARSGYRPTNMFNKSNATFDDFAEVRIIREGYAPLDTNVRIIEGVRNEFEFMIKPYVRFALRGTVSDNYGTPIKDNRLIVIHHPLNEPDTLFNSVVGSSYNCGTFVKVEKYLDDVMIKLIRYGYETYAEYVTLNPGNNNIEINLHKPLNDYLLTGLIQDELTGERLNKTIIIHQGKTVTDTIRSDNGFYQTTITDTTLSMVVKIEIAEDIDHAGSVNQYTVYARKPFYTEHRLHPLRIKYTLTGQIKEQDSDKPVPNARIFLIQQQDTLVDTRTTEWGFFNSGTFYWPEQNIFSARLEIGSDYHNYHKEYIQLKYGDNLLNRSLKR